MQQACRAGALVPAPAGILHHQTSGMSTGSCGLSGKGTRSSSSGGGSSPQQPCSGHSRCRCSSSGTPASTCRLAATERYEALAVLVRSARANLAKLPLVVCHLARQTGLLHLLCKEVLSAAGGAAQHSCGEAAADAGATTGRRRDTILQPKARQDTLQEVRLCSRYIHVALELSIVELIQHDMPCFQPEVPCWPCSQHPAGTCVFISSSHVLCCAGATGSHVRAAGQVAGLAHKLGLPPGLRATAARLCQSYAGCVRSLQQSGG